MLGMWGDYIMCYGPEGNEAQLQRSTIVFAIPWFDVVWVLWAGLLSMALSPFFHGIPAAFEDLWRWVDQWISSHGSPMDSYGPWKISGRGGCLWELQLHALQRGNGEDRDFAKVGGPSPGCLWCWYRLIPISSSIHCISLPCENLFFGLKCVENHEKAPFTICFTLACCKIGHGQIRMRSQTFSTPALLHLAWMKSRARLARCKHKCQIWPPVFRKIPYMLYNVIIGSLSSAKHQLTTDSDRLWECHENVRMLPHLSSTPSTECVTGTPCTADLDGHLPIGTAWNMANML